MTADWWGESRHPNCGSTGGYQRHLRGNETPCRPCWEAQRAYRHAWKARRALKRERARRAAESRERAAVLLVRQFPHHYLSFLLGERAAR